MNHCRVDALRKKFEKPQPRNHLKPPDELEKRSDNLGQSVYISVLNSTGLAALDAYSINQAHPKMTREKRRAAVLAREAALRRLAFSHLHRPRMGVRTDFTSGKLQGLHSGL